MMDTVLVDVEDGVATITLNRPEAKNRLDADTMAAVISHLESTAADGAVRVVVLTGTGNTFCAGADLSGALAAASGGFGAQGGTSLLAQLLAAVCDHPKPTIARVQGHVAGGGNGLVAACDLAVAATEAKFAFSEVRVGVAPAVIAVVCLPKMDPREAAELMLTGDRVSAQRALRAGLLNKVVEADQLDAAVRSYADALLQAGPLAVQYTKELLRRLPAMSREEGFAWTSELSARIFTSDEAREGMTAFLEKRSPSWVS